MPSLVVLAGVVSTPSSAPFAAVETLAFFGGMSGNSGDEVGIGLGFTCTFLRLAMEGPWYDPQRRVVAGIDVKAVYAARGDREGGQLFGLSRFGLTSAREAEREGTRLHVSVLLSNVRFYGLTSKSRLLITTLEMAISCGEHRAREDERACEQRGRQYQYVLFQSCLDAYICN